VIGRRSIAGLASALLLGGWMTAVLSGGASAGGATSGFAPLDQPGPALSVPVAKLRAALNCSDNFGTSKLEPVLLSPATGVTAEQNFSWNYERAFDSQHRPWCAVTVPDRTLGDIQVAGEYLVYAIRATHAKAHRRIAVLGHSQGGMSMRWALRFWPDTRAMVDDVIGMAADNHGTTLFRWCQVGLTTCLPAVWQQRANSQLMTALNSRAETFPGISYTEIFTRTDQVVMPSAPDAAASSSLHGGGGSITNVATQRICPLDIQEHILIGTVDPVAYALVMDALNHTGPAMPYRIARSVCLRLYQPGVDPLNVQNYLQVLSAQPALLSVLTPNVNLVGLPMAKAEPALRCYVYASGC
jgi:pimeloyl-ACP methyl ester carboxylesterase